MSLPENLNPLNNAHYDQIHEALRACNDARLLMNAAAGAGIDTTAHGHLCGHLEAQLNGIRNNFFPSGKRKP